MTRQAASAGQLVAACLLLTCGLCANAVKLKIQNVECLNHHFDMYEAFYGSFVSLPDAYYHVASYQLVITAPSGTKVHESQATTEHRFHLVPYETGSYKFCLTQADHYHYMRHGGDREVAWDLYMSHADTQSTHAKDSDTQGLWHYVHLVDAQLQQLRSTMSYLYWRERRHRMTIDSTNKKVLWYGLLRALALVAVSVVQVMGVMYLFRAK